VYALAGRALVGRRVGACQDAACLARTRPTIGKDDVDDINFASSAAPAQLLCSRGFEPVGRFRKEDLGQVKIAREKLVEGYIAAHRASTLDSHAT
ncbi:MAG: hypothetical protein H5U40_00035, partial [Polyangiaceae bacterium]|nr:hypothetical protein [Polyangiaceae bacterium]